jgi:hypothetical protein
LGSLNSIFGLKKSSERNCFCGLGLSKLGLFFSGGGAWSLIDSFDSRMICPYKVFIPKARKQKTDKTKFLIILYERTSQT